MLATGSQAYIAGSIASLGSEYVLGLRAVNCQDGVILAQQQFTARTKEQVLDALGQAAVKLRGDLGESLTTEQKFDVPLPEATTSSLEALKEYSLGLRAHRETARRADLAHFERAVQLDPSFAMAYRAAAWDYRDLGEAGQLGKRTVYGQDSPAAASGPFRMVRKQETVGKGLTGEESLELGH